MHAGNRACWTVYKSVHKPGVKCGPRVFGTSIFRALNVAPRTPGEGAQNNEMRHLTPRLKFM